jgi:hypothetical protein
MDSRDEFDAKLDRLEASFETLNWMAALIVVLDIAILVLLP